MPCSPRTARALSSHQFVLALRDWEAGYVDRAERYLAELGIHPFDEDFYAPDSLGFLVERKGPRVPRVREFPLKACETGGTR